MSSNREMFKENISILSEGGGGDWKKVAKEHACICAWPLDADNNVVKAGVGEWGGMVEVGAGWVEGCKPGENGGHL